MKEKITKKDFFQWQWMNTANAILSIINSHGHLREPYFIMLQTKKGYDGPPTFAHKQGHKLKTIKVEGKKITHQLIAILNYDPGPRLNTLVWRVDNQLGHIDLLRSLPPDKPFAVEDSDNFGPVVEKVAEEAIKIKDAIKWN